MVRALTTPFRSMRVWPWGSVPTAFVFLLGFSGCADETVVLSVGPVEYTATQLAGVPGSARELLIATTALTLAASNDEIVERATVLRAQTESDALADALRREITLAAAEVGDEQLRARYEVAPAYELDVRHLVLLAERTLGDAQRAEAEAKAAAALARVRAGEDFAAVAGEVSEEPGAAERGGLLQPGREGHWVDEFGTAAQSLTPGQISSVVESPFGFHVLKLDARRPIPFPEMRNRVAQDVAALLPAGPVAAFEDSLRTTLAGSAPATPDDMSRAMRDVALSRGLSPDSAYVERRLSDFRVEALGWAGTLGLVGSSDPVAVATRALSGLMATGQNATIARQGIQARAAVLRTFYPIVETELPETTGP